MGIDNTKKVVVALALLINAGDKSTQNGLGVDDIGNFITPLMKAPEAIAAFKDVKEEVKDIDTAEMAELVQLAKDNLDLVNDQLESIAEAVVDVAFSVIKIYQDIQKLRA